MNMTNNLKNTCALPIGYENINEMTTLVKCYYYFKTKKYNVMLVDGDRIEIQVKNLNSTGSMFVRVSPIDVDYYANLYSQSIK